jgi:hypothetical protein
MEKVTENARVAADLRGLQVASALSLWAADVGDLGMSADVAAAPAMVCLGQYETVADL